MSLTLAIAMNRFGLGARPGKLPSGKTKNFLLDQLGAFDPNSSAIRGLSTRAQIAEQFQGYRSKSRTLRRARENKSMAEEDRLAIEEQRKSSRRELRGHYADAVQARLSVAIESETDFVERLVYFWSNHFAISTEDLPVAAMAGDYEFAAIRPNILGKFADLLDAAILHPAMLLFLDQAQSMGPNSPLAERIANRRGRQFGLNENLAREILELHTLGVRTGYSQNDVTEFAKALTGLSIAGLIGGPMRRLSRDRPIGEVFFAEPLHEPGSRTIMGKTYRGDGRAQVKAIVADLATHPSTARHVATKLAKHFTSDNPPPSLVAKLEKNFLKTGGDLGSLYQTLIEAPEAWPQQWDVRNAKFKSPWEWVVSSLRGLNARQLPGRGRVAVAFRQMGQPIWKPGSPAGYADSNATWNGGSALMRRVDLAARLARNAGDMLDPRILGTELLPGVLSNNTGMHIARAESPEQGLSLLLVSPEFLRR